MKKNSYYFSHPLVARICHQIMTFYGCNALLLGTQIRRGENEGRGGFDFFARLYDGRPQ